MRAVTGRLLVVAVAIVLGGCAGAGKAQRGAPATAKCSRPRAGPFAVALVLDRINEHGFAAHPKDECGSPEVADISNEVVGGEEPGGYVLCDVESAPKVIGGFTFDEVTVREAEPERAVVVYQNVTCHLYPRGESDSYDLEALLAALRSLQP
jgi:hypothetical protein